jgi:PAS domain S-box-containing protein
MNRAMRLWVAVVPAALAAGVLAFTVSYTSDFQELPRLSAVLMLLTSWSFIAAGLVARTRRPTNRTGLLLIAVGFWWLVGSLWGSSNSLAWTIGAALGAVAAGFFVHLLLAYPSGRLESRWDRTIVAIGYGLTAIGNLPQLLVDETPIHDCDGCPTSSILITESSTARTVFTVLIDVAAVVFLSAVIATLVRRWFRSSPAARRALTPIPLAGAATLVLFGIGVVTQDIWPTVAEVAWWAGSFTVVAVPFLFLWGLLQSRLARADIGRALTEDPSRIRPQDAQARIRRLLHDPTAELLFWRGGNVRARFYADVDGNRREPPKSSAGRAVTPIEREGRKLGAIVHDEALLDEPDLLEQVAAAIGLEVDRDRSLFELQASEQRSRALLEAIPDSMFRISREGRILDYRVEPPIRLFRSAEGLIGSDVYEGDFPNEITERTMELGEQAIATGELQVHEYEVEIDGELRYQEERITRSAPDEFLVIIRDVTDRKRQEEQLRSSERRSRALIEAMPDNMFRISADGTFLDIQESTGSPTRVQAKVGSSVYDYPVPRAVIDRAMAAGKLALETGELQTIEWTIGERGDLRHQEGRFMPSGDGEFFVVVRDVTARKQQEVEEAALHRVAVAVAVGRRAEQIFDLVAEEGGHVLGAHSSNLFRYERDGAEAIAVGRWSEKDVYSEPIGTRFVFQGGEPGQIVYTTGRPVRFDLDEGTVQPMAALHMLRMGVNSIVAAPITVTGRLWGVMAARLMAPHSFPKGAEARLGAFTQLVSLALANEEARAQLAASRARLVAAGDEERRRLERNLHDGAQQRLVSVSVSQRLAQGKLESDSEGAKKLLTAANAELSVALEELRELARGIHPAVLTERGLGPALASLADRTPVPVELDGLPETRLPGQVEAAAYYVVSEALANVAKYAGASTVSVSVAQENGRAVVEVVDDGVGGADPERGSGLRGLTDRVEALEGRLSITSPPGSGTTIRAEIPCG